MQLGCNFFLFRCYDALPKAAVVQLDQQTKKPKNSQTEAQQSEPDADVVGVSARSSATSFWVTRQNQQQSSQSSAQQQQSQESQQKPPQQSSQPQQSPQPQQVKPVPADLGAISAGTENPKTCWSAGSAHLKKVSSPPVEKPDSKVNYLTFGGMSDAPVSIDETTVIQQ